MGGQLVLEAAGRHQAQVRSASLELDEQFVDSLQGGDVLNLVRTMTANVGVSVLRGDQLIVAVGAVTATPLGDEVVVRNGPGLDDPAHGHQQWPRPDTWVDVSVSGQARRLRGGEETTIGEYRFAVIRSYEDGTPGTDECLAISLMGVCSHEATMRSAGLLGLMMTAWP